MDITQAIKALEETGNFLGKEGVLNNVTIILGGGIAAMVTAGLSATRTTQDCDVLISEPDEVMWPVVQRAAEAIATQYDLPATWLNRDASMYAHWLPLGWRKRCQFFGQFGPLTVMTIGRRDLMAMKLFGASVRPQDLEDILAMKPAKRDFAFLYKHLDRLDGEALDGNTCQTQRNILFSLEHPNE